MTAQDLKKSILQLAIQGKLVEQRKEEGTAEELYKQIKEEKQKLIKENKIKKSKPLPEITNEEIPFDIPDTWKWVRLNEIVDMYTGNSISKSLKEQKYSKIDNGYDYIGTKDVNFNSFINYDNGTKIPFEEIKFRKAYQNSVLMCIEGGSAGRKIGILNKTVCFGNKLCAFNIILGEPKFIFYFLQSAIFYQSFKQNLSGIIGGVSINKLKSLIIPIPPLKEQKRIVEKIEELMPYIDKYDKVYNELTKLNNSFPTDIEKSILQYAIQGKLVEQREEEGTAEELYKQIEEEKQRLIKEKKIKKSKTLPEITEDEIPFDIPDSWKWVRLGNLGNNCEYSFADGPFGSNLKKIHYIDKPEVRIIQLSNIGENGWKNKNIKYTSYKHAETIKRSKVKIGNIVIAKMMPAGRAIEVPEIEKDYVLSSDAVKFVPHYKLNNKYLLYSINSNVFKKQIYSEVHGITRVRTSLSKIKKYIIPLPPLEEQKRIVEKIEELMNYTKKLN